MRITEAPAKKSPRLFFRRGEFRNWENICLVKVETLPANFRHGADWKFSSAGGILADRRSFAKKIYDRSQCTLPAILACAPRLLHAPRLARGCSCN
jgi:hypothetical protein